MNPQMAGGIHCGWSDVSHRISMTDPFRAISIIMKTSDERGAFPLGSEASGGMRFRPKPSRPGARRFLESAAQFSKPPRHALRMDHLPAQPESAQPTLPYPASVSGNPGFDSLIDFLRKHLFFILSICAAASVLGAAAGFFFARSTAALPMRAQSSEAEQARPSAYEPSPSETMAIGIAEMRRIAAEDADAPADQAQATKPGNNRTLATQNKSTSRNAFKDASAPRTQAAPVPDQPCSAASMALALCGESLP